MDLEADRPPEAPAGELGLDRLEEVSPLVLLDLEVGVAGHPEGVVADDLHAREQLAEVGGDDELERDETLTVGHDDEAGKDGGHLDPGEASHPGLGVAHGDGEVEREVGDVGERVGGIDREGGDDGEDPVPELAVEIGPVLVVEGLVPGELDPRRGELGSDLVEEDPARPHVLALGGVPDGRELSGNAHAVDRDASDPVGELLLEPRHPDHEELVEVRRPDGEEARPLEERELPVLGEGEHPAVEIEPRKLAVEVAGHGLAGA